MAGNTLAIQLTVGADGLVEGLKVAGKNVDGAAQQMRASFSALGAAAKEASEPVEHLGTHIRAFAMEERSQGRLGSFLAAQITEMGLAGKGAASGIAQFVSAFAYGGGIGVATEGVKLLVAEILKGDEEIQKFTQDAAKEVTDLTIRVDGLLASMRHATEGEKLQHEALGPLLRAEANLKQELIKLNIKAAEAIEAAAEAENKHRASAQQLALNERDSLFEEINKKQKLLDITQEQIKLDREQVGRVDKAESSEARKKAREELASDNAKWNAFELQEDKKHYDAVMAETLKFFQDADKAEDEHAVRVIEDLDKATQAWKKHYDAVTADTLEAMRKLDAEQARLTNRQIALAEGVVSALGSFFEDVVSTSNKSTGEMLKSVILAVTKSIEAYALQAAAAAAAAHAWNPVALAVFASAAFAFVEGLIASLPSAAVGMPRVAGDGPVFVHKNEAILTTSEAEDWRAGGGGGGGGTFHNVFNFHGPVSDRSLDQFEGALVRVIRRARRNGRI